MLWFSPHTHLLACLLWTALHGSILITSANAFSLRRMRYDNFDHQLNRSSRSQLKDTTIFTSNSKLYNCKVIISVFSYRYQHQTTDKTISSNSIYMTQRTSTMLYAKPIPTENDSLLQDRNSPIDNYTNEVTDKTSVGNLPPIKELDNKATGRTILELAIPAAGALLIDPLMTLADTAFVGHYSTDGANQLSGMGSAAALLTFSFYLFNFLCTAITPLVGKQRAAGNTIAAQTVAGQALSLAIGLGIALSLFLWTFSQPLLLAMGTSITGDVANMYALQFLTIRALAAPAIFCIEASTGVLRGYLDTQTPIFVLVAANLVNLTLDIVLIAVLGFGPLGAAIATTTAEWISAALFLAVLAGRLTLVQSSPWTRQIQNDTSLTITPTFSIPTWQSFQPLLAASSSVFLRALVLQLSLSLAAAMAARSDNANVAVAAHQIGIQLWLICSFFCDSLAAASQGLVADALGRDDAKAVRDVSRTVFIYSVVLGLGLATLLQVGDSTGVLYSFFTPDTAVQQTLSSVLPLIVVAQPLNALVFAADGVLQGASEFPFQAKAMFVSGSAAVATFFVLQSGLVNGDANTLVHVWTALIALQFIRGLTSFYKLVDPKGPINLLER